MLSFVLKEAGDDIGYEDQYPIEPVVVTIGNYIGKTSFVSLGPRNAYVHYLLSCAAYVDVFMDMSAYLSLSRLGNDMQGSSQGRGGKSSADLLWLAPLSRARCRCYLMRGEGSSLDTHVPVYEVSPASVRLGGEG